MMFAQEALHKALQSRYLLNEPLPQHQKSTLKKSNQKGASSWKVSLGERLLFDFSGLQVIQNALNVYQGSAQQLTFRLKLSKEARRDYYSHNSYLDDKGFIDLPITAERESQQDLTISSEAVTLTLPEIRTPINYPLSLTAADFNSTPVALLMPYSCEHDCLFANQIAIFSHLNQALRRSPQSWLKGLLSGRKTSLKQRISLSWKQVHPTANIHPTAVIEGAQIGKNCRIGAHCVVRYSVLGNDVQLHDGAKVEYSVIGDNSWLMHDLVLYRSLLEQHVFLIHGPYQFSYFQNESAAFASIMMDYRPDNKPIRINTSQGIREYQGRFLGALLEERAKVYGGTLTAPGITIPGGKELTTSIKNITTAKDLLQEGSKGAP